MATRDDGLSFGSLLQGSSVLAAVLYTYGWIISARFYGSFGVSPEEVGIGVSYLTVRVFFVLAAIALVLGVLWTGLRRASRRLSLVEVDTRPFRRLGSAALDGFGGLVLLAGSLDNTGVIEPPIWLVVGAGLALAVWLFVFSLREEQTYANEDDDSSALRVNFGRILDLTLWLMTAVAIIVVVILVPMWLSAHLTSDVRSGHDIDLPVLPGVAGISVERVRVSTQDDEAVAPGTPRNDCLAFFGSAGGVVVLYDVEDRRTIRVPQSRVTLRSPC